MAEETDGYNAGAETSGAGVDPAAVALALGGASRAEADAYLKDQRTLIANQNAFIADQRHHLREQLQSLRLTIWEKRAGMLLRVATAIVGIAFATFLGAVVWDAAHADGLVVESFSVPPDMTAQGLTGQVVAAQMLDKLTVMNDIQTSRAPQTYANNWGDDIKLEIPETGVSVGEAYRFLRGWLGHETHVSGEVYRTATGIAVTARLGSESGATFTGAQSELDALVKKAAEHVYSVTQPYRYGVYLSQQGDLGAQGSREARIAVFQALARTGSKSEQGWAYNGLGTSGFEDGEQLEYFRRGVELDPTNFLTTNNLAGVETSLGHPEQALRDAKKAQSLLSQSGHGQIREDFVASNRQRVQARIDSLLGAFHDAAPEWDFYIQSGQATGSSQSLELGEQQLSAHEVAAARATLTAYHRPRSELSSNTQINDIQAGELEIEITAAQRDWNTITAQAAALQPLVAQSLERQRYHLNAELKVALAEAQLGRIADAQARLADTPADCYQCLRARARMAEIKGDNAGADSWFDRAVKSNPAIPFADAEWGQALLERGQPDAAIAKFKLATQKGPHFSDPLEFWGEALMKKNQSHLALAKFAEAEKYAPNWGRLHLKWGEALGYAGKKDEAAREFAKAASLDLTAAEKSELAAMNHG